MKNNRYKVINLVNNYIKRTNRLYRIASATTIFVLIFTLNILLPFGGSKIVKSLEKEYDSINFYHKHLAGASVEIPRVDNGFKPQVEVPFNLEVEKGTQKSVDAGHSPWKLDLVFVAQVFVSLQLSPEGIVGDYPVKESELKIIQNNGVEAIVQVNSSKIATKKVYLKKIVRPDSSGIWTVVGYDVK